MKLSLQDLFCDKQTIATEVTDTASTNTLDWAKHKNDVSRKLTLFCMVDAAGTFGASGTIKAKFQTSADNSSWTTLAETPALTELAKGQMIFNQPMPKGLKQYNRLFFTTAVAAFTVAPKFTAGIVNGDVDQAFQGL